ncbi:hypothetical protein RBS60_00080 [Sinomonas sp. ASV486]|uniref:hypothetical protein n=1 Tax=Sinomonas sp. ASV486 TaxID=3051170 RepID=UPI0027DCF183|nr:hypothetical protein [Sinomonas sp. ASV486]MDQ4488589.1 hypothetical protein [Sinomonas sp. ASV486]
MTAPMRLELIGVPAVVHWGRGIGDEDAARLAAAWSRCHAVFDDSPDHEAPDDDALDDDNPPEDNALAAAAAGKDSPAESPEPADTGGFSVRAVLAVGGAAPVAVEAATVPEFASYLTSSLTVAAIEERAGELMMLHASGLAEPGTGRTVALVARSGMGKTTATRQLATRFGYVSDETVAVDRSGRILPYPKPLSVIDDPPPAPKVQRGPDELGLAPAPAGATLAGVVLLERQAGLEAAVVEPVGHADAITDLTPQTSALARIERPLAWLCGILDACGGAVRVRYTEAEQLAAVLPDVISLPALAPSWRDAHDGALVASGATVPPLAKASPGGAAGPGPGRVRRREVVDAVAVPGADGGAAEVLVLAGPTLLRLGGIAPAVWDALAGTTGGAGLTRADLAAALEVSIGLPDGYEPILDAALAELKASGLVDVVL